MWGCAYDEFAGPITVRQVPDPSPPGDGVVVEVAASGLCRSDWHGWMGHDPAVTRLPHVPGHEFAGRIVAVGGDVGRWQVGDRVTAPFVMACGQCSACASGNGQVCPAQWQPGFDGWGSHAQFVALPRADANLVAVPDGVDLVLAAGLGCRVTTAHRAVVARSRVAPGQWLAVHGCGGVGLAAVLVAVGLGIRVVAVDVDRTRLAEATALGADHVVVAGEDRDVVAAVVDLTGGGAHAGIDAVGDPDVAAGSIRSLRPGGTHVQVGLLPRGAHLPMEVVVARELHVVGSHGMAAEGVGAVMAMVADGRLDPARLGGARVGLAEGARLMMAAGEFSTAGMSVIDVFDDRG